MLCHTICNLLYSSEQHGLLWLWVSACRHWLVCARISHSQNVCCGVHVAVCVAAHSACVECMLQCALRRLSRVWNPSARIPRCTYVCVVAFMLQCVLQRIPRVWNPSARILRTLEFRGSAIELSRVCCSWCVCVAVDACVLQLMRVCCSTSMHCTAMHCTTL